MKKSPRRRILVVCLLCCFSIMIFAQQVTFKVKNVTVKTAIIKFKKATGYSFVFGSSKVDTNKRISVNANNQPLRDVISQILVGQNLDYEINGKFIVVKEKQQIEQKTVSPQRSHYNSSQIKATGRVTDEKGEPIIGATVKVKGSSIGTVTDLEGKFSLNTLYGSTLEISYIGYKMQSIKVENKFITIYLAEESKNLNEVVVVGYGSQLRREITGAISSVKGNDIDAPNAVSVDNLLQGRIAGLTINQLSAQPGSAMSINIRGKLSPNGSNEPLYVIDGVVISSNSNKASKVGPSRLLDYSLSDGSNRSPLSTLNPDDIASVDVLKDASAAAIYGSQAANGVILITTKKGQAGTPKITYNGSLSIQSLGKYYHMLNAWDFMSQCNLGAKEQWLYDNKYYPYGTVQAPSSGYPIIYTDDQIAKQTDSYDHFNEITRTGIINDHNVSVSAGSEKVKLYSSINFYDQKSILKTTALKRLGGRINLEFDFNKWLTLRINNMYTYIKANNPSVGHWRENANEANQTNAAMYFSPRIPLKNADGTLTSPENQLTANPLKFSLIKDNTTTKRLMFVPNLEIRFTPWLKGNVQFSADETSDSRDIFSPTEARMPQQIQNNYGGYSNAYNDNYSMEEYLTLDKRFGLNHSFNATIGTGFYCAKGNSYQFCVFNLPTDALQNNAVQMSSDVDDTTYGSNRWQRNKLSFFGRVNYTYLDRYIVGATLRHDGSSAFAENHKWGWFHGISAAWIISSEKFMKSTSNWLDYLKFRAGYGTSGNESILTGNNYMLTTYGNADAGGWFFFNNIQTNGLIQKQKGNKNLKWETDITLNLGIDYELFHNRISGSIDYYVRTAKDLLDFAVLPANDVVGSIAKNIGETRSKGVELSVKCNIIQNKNWNWDSYFNLSHNKSYWVKRNPEVSISPWVKYHGELNAFYGWKTNGIFKSQEEIQQYTSNGKVLQPNAYVGNLKYVDVNGDGVMDDKDIVKLGCWDPAVNYGVGTTLSYKNWQLDIDAYGVIGQKTTNGWGYTGFLGSTCINESTHVFERWSTFNPSGWRPGIAADVTGNNNKSGTNDFTLINMWFMRLKNVKLTYNLPKVIVHNLNISNLSVYLDVQNSLLLTNYKGLDPEMEKNSAPFPISKTFVIGVNIAF